MATILNETLKQRYAALQAERERTWPAAQLEGNARQRRTLVERFDPQAVAQPGDIVPAHDLVDVDGGTLSLDELTEAGPVVLIFFRFEGCPACNIALPHYAEALYPALQEQGIDIVAVSPQQPDRLRSIRDRHALPFAVATDPDNALARSLGIAFEPEDRPVPPPPGWIGEVTGTGHWDLPQPAVLLLLPGRKLAWLQVSPDWLDRPEADEVLAAVLARA